jgi:hypothetical protein
LRGDELNKFVLSIIASFVFVAVIGPATAQVRVLAPNGVENVYGPGGQNITTPEQRAHNERIEQLQRERRAERARQERLEQIEAESKRARDDLAQRLGEIDERARRRENARRR